MPPARKRPAPQSVTSVKRARGAVSIGASRNTAIKIKQDPDGPAHSGNGNNDNNNGSSSSSIKSTSNKQSVTRMIAELQEEFIALFQEPRYKDGISNSTLKSKFGESKYLYLVDVMNHLMKESKLNISRLGDELFYQLVSDDLATRLSGLDETSRMVYQFIERAGNLGIWTKDIKIRSNIHQQTLNKIIKTLEGRKLVKPVKSVNSKTKNLYMLYDLIPAEEITGGAY